MNQTQSFSNQLIPFRYFWNYISQELGSAWLNINERAINIHDFVSISYDPKEYLKEIIIQSYKSSHCSNLNSPININSVLDILGETAFHLKDAEKDDLFDIELLEEIAWHVGQRFFIALENELDHASSNELLNKDMSQNVSGITSNTESGILISLNDHKMKKENLKY